MEFFRKKEYYIIGNTEMQKLKNNRKGIDKYVENLKYILTVEKNHSNTVSEAPKNVQN